MILGCLLGSWSMVVRLLWCSGCLLSLRCCVGCGSLVFLFFILCR